MKTLFSEDRDKKGIAILVTEADVVTVSKGAYDLGRFLIENGARRVTEAEFFGIAQLDEESALTSKSDCLKQYKKNTLGGFRYVTHVGGGHFDTHAPYEKAKISVYQDTQSTYAIQTKIRMNGAPVECDSHLIIEVSSLNEGCAIKAGTTLKQFLEKNYSVQFSEDQVA